MRKHHLLLSALAIIAGSFIVSSCKKDLDTPPEQTLPVGSVITLQQLRDMYSGTPIHFDTALSVYATVTADEGNGNLYKEVYIQAGTAAIDMRLLYSGGLYQGDSIRIYLPGCVLSSYNGMLQLDSVDVDNNVVKQATLVHVEPQVVTVAEITPALQGHLIRLDSVEFVSGELGLPYADAANQVTENRMLEDCNGDQIIVRTSGYANFAGFPLPVGRGHFTAIVGQYASDMQLYIRDLNEVQLNGLRCDGSSGGACDPVLQIQEAFTAVVQYDPISIPCWKNLATAGGTVWEGGVFMTTSFARCEAYNSGDASNVAWLVTPPTTFDAGTTLSFISEKAYWTHDPMQVLISTDFDGITPGTATWTPITCTRATDSDADYTWIPSGNIDLAPYLPLNYTGSFVIAFKYTGSGTGALTTRYDIDDVAIQ